MTEAEMMEGYQVQRSIGFPSRMLDVIDAHARNKNSCRTQVVVTALKEYLRNHKILEKINI